MNEQMDCNQSKSGVNCSVHGMKDCMSGSGEDLLADALKEAAYNSFIIKESYNKPYDSVFRKTDKLFSKLRLKYLNFSKIKGNVQRCSETIEEVRASVNDAIEELMSNNAVNHKVLGNILKPTQDGVNSLREQFSAIQNYVNLQSEKENAIKAKREAKIREKEDKKRQKVNAKAMKPVPQKFSPPAKSKGNYLKGLK